MEFKQIFGIMEIIDAGRNAEKFQHIKQCIRLVELSQNRELLKKMLLYKAVQETLNQNIKPQGVNYKERRLMDFIRKI